ncbi:MAG: hypothetical protein AB1938_32180 [Myxococcota bacterium]
MSGLTPVTENLWRAQTRIRLGPGFSMPVASALWRDSSGAVTIVSPIAFTDEQAAAIDALGPIRHILAPNRFHHLAVPKAKARWPKARLWAAPGLPAKRQDVTFDGELRTGATELPDADVVLLEGAPRANELLVIHRPSRTLVAADLIFNLHDSGGWLGWLYFKASGALGKPAPSVWWRFLVEDRAATKSSLERLLAMDFARVLPSHGLPIEGDAKQVLRTALARMLRG